METFRNSERGQVLLIIVLVMVISLTVGLSLAIRSITNVRSAKEEDNSQRAFSAAEAGIEQALKTACSDAQGCAITGDFTVDNRSTFQASLKSISGTDLFLKGGIPVAKDDGSDLWLVPHTNEDVPDYTTPWNGTLTFHYGSSSNPCVSSALEVIVLSGTIANPASLQSKRYTFDQCATRTNNFSASLSGGAFLGKTLYYKSSALTITNGLLIRVVPLYNDSIIGVAGSSSFPVQGKQIESTGISDTTTRKVTFLKGYPELPPEFFHYILFSTQ